MPTWSGILAEIEAEVAKGNPSAFDVVRRKYLAALAAHTKRNVILYATKWTQPGDHDPNLISITEEDVQGLMEVVHGLPGKDLDLIMHSPGGSAEAAESLVHYLRAKFDHIRVIVPHAAMSAATLVACAANEIVMGKQSSLGPVDPQYIISDPSGRSFQAVPAQAILDQFSRAKQECKDPQLLGAWAPMLGQYGPALLVQCENALKLAENLAAEWLRTWMLATTKGKKGAVKARSIAKALRDHKRFKSHARHSRATRREPSASWSVTSKLIRRCKTWLFLYFTRRRKRSITRQVPSRSSRTSWGRRSSRSIGRSRFLSRWCLRR